MRMTFLRSFTVMTASIFSATKCARKNGTILFPQKQRPRTTNDPQYRNSKNKHTTKVCNLPALIRGTKYYR